MKKSWFIFGSPDPCDKYHDINNLCELWWSGRARIKSLKSLTPNQVNRRILKLFNHEYGTLLSRCVSSYQQSS